MHWDYFFVRFCALGGLSLDAIREVYAFTDVSLWIEAEIQAISTFGIRSCGAGGEIER